MKTLIFAALFMASVVAGADPVPEGSTTNHYTLQGPSQYLDYECPLKQHVVQCKCSGPGRLFGKGFRECAGAMLVAGKCRIGRNPTGQNEGKELRASLACVSAERFDVLHVTKTGAKGQLSCPAGYTKGDCSVYGLSREEKPGEGECGLSDYCANLGCTVSLVCFKAL